MIQLVLAPEVTLAADATGTVSVAHPVHGRTVLRDVDAGVTAALLALHTSALRADELAERARAVLPEADLTRLRHEVTRFARWGLIRFGLVVGGRPIAEVTLTGDLAPVELARDEAAPPAPEQTVRLSRFAYLRRRDDTVVIESPTAYSRVAIREAAVAAALPLLAQPVRVADVCAAVDCPPETTREFLGVLVGAGVAGLTDDAGQLPEDTDPQVAQREFHDVLTHRLSRRGLTDERIGSVYLFQDRFPPLPAVKPVGAFGGEPVPLPRPDIDHLVRADPPLAGVMERRRSTRAFGTAPLALEQLGEFLFRVARVRAERPADPEAGIPYGSTDRTYPSGGGAHDLELYLSVRSCTGLRPGIYHYEPVIHALTLVTATPKLLVGMLNEAHWSIGRESVPQVLVTVASRFNRLGWKYRGISYALTLKNVGVLLEAMCLAATAMNLGACALGSGNSAMFSAATGLDPLVESSVGELVLGTLPGPATPGTPR
ncbi:SagB family peptide dehydrogenase [Micromonospora sp. NPDC048170]|uniref:SagB family peptide dehydrogenase n=1 Tax=Micromonospora sp. NPDC048170 TaxID=3154819 RepID=UPI0033D1DE49